MITDRRLLGNLSFKGHPDGANVLGNTGFGSFSETRAMFQAAIIPVRFMDGAEK